MDEPSSRPSLSRRSLLVCGVACCGAFAGCAVLGGCSAGYFLSMSPATDGDYLEETLAEPHRNHRGRWARIVSTAVERGEARDTTFHEPPVRDGDLVEYDGRFYRLSRRIVATKEVETHLFSVDYESGRDPPRGATVVDFEALPESDRAALGELLPDPGRRFETTAEFGFGYAPVVYPDDGGADSVLIGEDSTWVRYEDEDEVVEVAFEGTERTEQVTYGFDAEELAADREAYLEWVRESFVVELGDVDGAERAVLSRAIESDGEEITLCEPEGAEREVIERLEAIPESRTVRHRTWFIEFEREVYLTELVEFVS